jgi:hypothetical protein
MHAEDKMPNTAGNQSFKYQTLFKMKSQVFKAGQVLARGVRINTPIQEKGYEDGF